MLKFGRVGEVSEVSEVSKMWTTSFKPVSYCSSAGSCLALPRYSIVLPSPASACINMNVNINFRLVLVSALVPLRCCSVCVCVEMCVGRVSCACVWTM